jgi:hypothetical protein
MSVAMITGSAGLVGSEAVSYFSALGMNVVGIDNDLRGKFFGQEASTNRVRNRLCAEILSYKHHDVYFRDADAISRIFEHYGNQLALIIHTAAQPSHDWAATNPDVASLSTPMEPPCFSRRHGDLLRMPFSFLCQPIRFTETAPTNSLWSSARPGGKSMLTTPMQSGAFPKLCLSTTRCIACLECRRWQRTSWCKSTDDILE